MTEIRSSSISRAWLEAIHKAAGSPRREVSPLVVLLDVSEQGSLDENPELRAALDKSLEINGRATIETVANTLFPNSLWNPAKSRRHLFQRYLKILPKLRQYPQNRRGLYFERLINYPGTLGQPGKNQLDHIIDTFTRGNHRRSALQAAIFSPVGDLNHARQLGFPCLQQVAFAHHQACATLTVTGFYAMQFLFERAYGNYLGLVRLGRFMAHEMGLSLERVVCVSGIARLEVPAIRVTPIMAHFFPSLANDGKARSVAT